VQLVNNEGHQSGPEGTVERADSSAIGQSTVLLLNVDYIDYKLFVSKLWPIDQANAYFQRFETLFYELICSSGAYCIFTGQNETQPKILHPFAQCSFIDYELLNDENGELGRLMKTFLSDTQTRSGCQLVDLPISVRQKLKTISKSTERFISNRRALELIILNKDTLECLWIGIDADWQFHTAERLHRVM
jgi:hypothetical protein